MKNFIFVISVVGLYFVASANSLIKEMSEYERISEESRDSCKHLLSNETRESLRINRTSDNEDFQCYRTCFLKHDGTIKDGKINIENYEKIFDEHQRKRKNLIMNAAKICAEEANGEEIECKVGGFFLSCLNRELMKFYRHRFAHLASDNHNQHL